MPLLEENILIIFICLVICQSTSIHRALRQAFQDDNLKCPNGRMFYVHPADCRFYYHCWEHQNNDYQKFYSICPSGTIFSLEFDTCVPGKAENCSKVTGGSIINSENKGNIHANKEERNNHNNGKKQRVNCSKGYHKKVKNKVLSLNHLITYDDNNRQGNVYDDVGNNEQIESYDDQSNNERKDNIINNKMNWNKNIENSNYNIVESNKNDNIRQNGQKKRINSDNLRLNNMNDGRNVNDGNINLNPGRHYMNNLEQDIDTITEKTKSKITQPKIIGTTPTAFVSHNKQYSKSTISSKSEMTGYLQNPIDESVLTDQSILNFMANSLKNNDELDFTVELTGFETTVNVSNNVSKKSDSI